MPEWLVPVISVAAAGVIYARGLQNTARRHRWERWRAVAFFAGLAVILGATVGPIDALADDLFSVHMLEHMLLIGLAPPLLLLGQPVRPILLGLPAAVRRRGIRPLARASLIRNALHLLLAPIVAAAIFAGGLYVWHWPALYDAALDHRWLHDLEHAYFLLSALLYWSIVIDAEPSRSRLGYPMRILYLVITGAATNTCIGALLAFSSRVFYPYYVGRTSSYGLLPITDQQIGGAVMWVPGGLLTLVAISVTFFVWLAAEEREQRVREADRTVEVGLGGPRL